MRRPLLLTGMMGTGKTTVGKAAAAKSGVPFVDLDERVAAAAGAPIQDVFRSEGEAAFRQRERAELDRVLADGAPQVVALGGGSLLDRAARLRALSRATIVSLCADTAVVATRIGDPRTRPLLAAGDPTRLFAELLAAREESYAEAHARVDTTDGDVDRAASEALAVAERDPLVVALGSRTYPVDVTAGDDALFAAIESAAPTGVLVVSDRSVYPHVRDRVVARLGSRLVGTYLLEPGERSKSVESLLGGWLAARDAGLDRRGLVVAIGGGVVTDLAGMIAGTWLRGVRWVAAPTSVLATVDAAIGGKTGIDFGSSKNSIGAFHQPIAVCADVRRLATEPRRSFRAGLAEVVKAALVGDAALLDRLERDAEKILEGDPAALVPCLRAGAAVKTAIVSRDEREGGDRALLNMGHTLGHALEAAGGFGRWLHGEAVSLGTVGELRTCAALGVAPPSLVDRVTVLLDRLGLPTHLRRAEIEEALPLLVHDKKREGRAVRFILVSAPGRAEVRSLPIAELEKHFLHAAR